MTNQHLNNETHLRRRSTRLARRDYSFPGTYFVTICARERHTLFGRIQNAKLIPAELGQLVRECWVAIPLHFPQVELHEFVIMPNHLHGLIAILRKASAAAIATALAQPLVGAQQLLG